MILWQIQHPANYKAFKKNGILKGDWRRPDDKSFLPAYKWMADQMVKRGILKKPTSFEWAWHTYWDKKKRMPDFRCEDLKRQLKYHKKVYRVTFEAPDELVLLSDYHLWHDVLNGRYLALSEQEDKKIYPESDLKKKRRKRKKKSQGIIWHWPDCGRATLAQTKKSWEHIFNLKLKSNPSKKMKDWIGDDSDLMIQACLPYIKMEWATKIEEFNYNGKKKKIR